MVCSALHHRGSAIPRIRRKVVDYGSFLNLTQYHRLIQLLSTEMGRCILGIDAGAHLDACVTNASSVQSKYTVWRRITRGCVIQTSPGHHDESFDLSSTSGDTSTILRQHICRNWTCRLSSHNYILPNSAHWSASCIEVNARCKWRVCT